MTPTSAAVTLDRVVSAVSTAISVPLAACAGGAVVAAAAGRFGPVAGLAIIAALLGVFLVLRPVVAFGFLGSMVVLAENDAQAMLSARRAVYQSLGGLPVTPLVLVFALAAVAVVLHLDRRGEPMLTLPGPFVVPLGLTALAVPPALLSGLANGADLFDAISELVGITLLVGTPVVATSLIAHRTTTRAVAVAVAALAGLKTVEGLVSWLIGAGRPLGGTTITYYEPTALWLLLLFVVGAVALVLRTSSAPPVLVVGSVLAVMTILLSLRRGFWVGSVVALAIAVLVATGRRGRALLLPAGAVVAVAAVIALQAGGATDTRNVALERAQSVAPSRLSVNDEDRYRLVEQENVRNELVEHPVTGRGLAAGWRATTPLPLEHEGGRLYVHFVLLWHWLKLGLIGAVAYVLLVVVAVRTGYSIWRRHPDEVVRAGGLAVALGTVGLAIVELTASFTGVSPRFTVLFGIVIGWLAVAWRESATMEVRS